MKGQRSYSLCSLLSEFKGYTASDRMAVSDYEEHYVRFEVSTAVTMMIIIFWEMIIIMKNTVCDVTP
jgi:hypothetical protein